jgi:hypothetical protein
MGSSENKASGSITNFMKEKDDIKKRKKDNMNRQSGIMIPSLEKIILSVSPKKDGLFFLLARSQIIRTEV